VDGGATFQLQAGAGLPQSPRVQLASDWTRGGTVLAALDAMGLWVVFAGGAGSVRVPTITVAHAVALGSGRTIDEQAVWYVFGTTTAQAQAPYQVWASTTAGDTWVPIVDPAKGLGNWAEVLTSPRQAPGVVVIGSFGRGALWANASAALWRGGGGGIEAPSSSVQTPPCCRFLPPPDYPS